MSTRGGNKRWGWNGVSAWPAVAAVVNNRMVKTADPQKLRRTSRQAGRQDTNPTEPGVDQSHQQKKPLREAHVQRAGLRNEAHCEMERVTAQFISEEHFRIPRTKCNWSN